jgi:thiaminase
MKDFVGWMRETIDCAQPSEVELETLRRIFQEVLRYEYLFWEMAYRGEEWPA